jgi:peptide/nickel transport system permease protein
VLKVYILKRIARVVPVLLLVSMATFALLHLAPGGPISVMTSNPKVTGADLERIRESYGLDRPLPVRYLIWFRQVFLRLDLGTSYVTGEPVSRMILDRLPATLELVAISFVLALVLSLLAGVLSALKKGTIADDLVSVISTAGISAPVFWIGLMAIALFSLRLGLLPSGGREAITEGGSLIDRLRHLVLPVSVLSLAYFASWTRYVRSSVLEAVRGDFVRTARAKGLNERVVILKHVMRNAVLPIVTIIFMQIPTIFTGAVITETVFSWPGMGRLFYEGLVRHDYSRVMGIVVIVTIIIIFFNLVGDLVCMAIDPRYTPFGGERSIDRRYTLGGAV